MYIAIPAFWLAVLCVFETFGCLVVLVIIVVLGQCVLDSNFPWYCLIRRSCKIWNTVNVPVSWSPSFTMFSSG